jgi:hypothetical protein
MYALPQGTTLGGLTPPLHFKKGKPTSNACFFYMGIKNGKFIELKNTRQPTGPSRRERWPSSKLP